MYVFLFILKGLKHGKRMSPLKLDRNLVQVDSDEIIDTEIMAADLQAAADCADGTCTLPATQHLQIRVSHNEEVGLSLSSFLC